MAVATVREVRSRFVMVEQPCQKPEDKNGNNYPSFIPTCLDERHRVGHCGKLVPSAISVDRHCTRD